MKQERNKWKKIEQGEIRGEAMYRNSLTEEYISILNTTEFKMRDGWQVTYSINGNEWEELPFKKIEKYKHYFRDGMGDRFIISMKRQQAWELAKEFMNTYKEGFKDEN